MRLRLRSSSPLMTCDVRRWCVASPRRTTSLWVSALLQLTNTDAARFVFQVPYPALFVRLQLQTAVRLTPEAINDLKSAHRLCVPCAACRVCVCVLNANQRARCAREQMAS